MKWFVLYLRPYLICNITEIADPARVGFHSNFSGSANKEQMFSNMLAFKTYLIDFATDRSKVNGFFREMVYVSPWQIWDRCCSRVFCAMNHRQHNKKLWKSIFSQVFHHIHNRWHKHISNLKIEYNSVNLLSQHIP